MAGKMRERTRERERERERDRDREREKKKLKKTERILWRNCSYPSDFGTLISDLGEGLARLKSWAWLPKFCRTFGVLCEGS